MRTKTEKLTILGLGVCLAAQLTWAQGSLTPPGAPAPTMKTLEQIEPRRLIAVTGYRITQPGSYYLATNLITADGISGIPAIQIFTNDVTVDLNGFSILGESGGGNGIQVNPGCRNILVRNGTIRDCYYQGLQAGSAAQCAFEDLRILNNGHPTSSDGLLAGKSAKVVNCRMEGNGGKGLVIGDAGEVRGCSIVSNADGLAVGSDCRIEGNTIMDNADDGLLVTGSGSYVADNIVKGNADNYDLASGNHLNLLICEVPESLDWPCSVRLAGTLTCTLTGTNGITVNADDVTIDLGGHALIGPGASSGHGIYQADTFRNLTACNGKVVNWPGSGGGVYVRGTGNQFHGLQVATNSYGINAGSDCMFSDCAAYDNSNYGIRTGSGCTLSGCAAYGNSGSGISVDSGCTLNGCTVNDSSGVGIGAGNGCVLSHCAVNDSSGVGIIAGVGCTLSHCAAYHNSNDGINVADGCTLRGCAACYNTGDGIRIYTANRIEHCVCSQNGFSGDGAGIHATGPDNRIDGNDVTKNDRGIDVDSAGNFIARNTASGNTTNWTIVAGNVCLVVQAVTAGAISGDSGGTAPGSTDPSANFTY